MSYEKSIPFNGNVSKAFEVARNTLLPNGFIIVENGDDYMELTGPNNLCTKGQNSILGVSKVAISAQKNALTIEADFGSVRKSIKFLIFFIIGMSVFFLVFFGVVFRNNPKYSPFYSLLVFAPWPVIIPVMGLVMKSRATKSLDALLDNMAVLGKEK
jgi:hypothetical protein